MPPTSSPSSALGSLVDAEVRLDRALEAARDAATAATAAARRRAEDAAATLDAEIEHARARIAGEIAAATAAQLGAIAEDARVHTARFDAVRGDALAQLGRALAERLARLALDEAAP